MKVVNRQQWGFLLEHEGSQIFLPYMPQIMMGMMKMHHQVQISQNRGVIIASGDKAFCIDPKGNEFIIGHDSELATLIKECVVKHIKAPSGNES